MTTKCVNEIVRLVPFFQMNNFTNQYYLLLSNILQQPHNVKRVFPIFVAELEVRFRKSFQLVDYSHLNVFNCFKMTSLEAILRRGKSHKDSSWTNKKAEGPYKSSLSRKNLLCVKLGVFHFIA